MANFGASFQSNVVRTGSGAASGNADAARKALTLQRAFEDFQSGTSCVNSVVTTNVSDAIAYFEILFRDCDIKMRDDDDDSNSVADSESSNEDW